MDKKGDPHINELLLEELRKVAVMNGFSGEYRYWVLLCGLFNAEKSRNIVNHWIAHEKAFLKLVEQDGKLGPKHLLQSIILFFIRRYPTEMGQYAATFMKKLYDQDIFSEEFIIKWFNKKAKLDKTCGLYDRKAEKAFRASIKSFVNWLE